MLAIVGTVPCEDVPIVIGKADLQDGLLQVEDRRFPVNRGTPALLAASVTVCKALGLPLPLAYLVGDTGPGKGSRRLYDYLTRHIGEAEWDVLTFHYLQPDADWHNKVLFAIEDMPDRPVLIADAGFMYAAKMSGQAEAYDLFTPDVGELAFLADEEAPHPFYTRGFILHREDATPEMIARAYEHANAARNLLVKGRKDYVADRKGIRAIVDQPSEEALEAIGGTGDTLTGIVSALIEAGMPLLEASQKAARINRIAGALAQPTPASQVLDIIAHIAAALKQVL
ncbi:NAD(P)H-hydrate dehydratase [Desulfatiglans anilini]|uniref:NAD(P)H-hydrate dehydratase n=1 Tax=Desulfatiglans anilini TaxID=90728 RepID=UPI0003FCFE64|nr:NAD(P)H-hydrate dehydratase [Desulfatiglans anilini]